MPGAGRVRDKPTCLTQVARHGGPRRDGSSGCGSKGYVHKGAGLQAERMPLWRPGEWADGRDDGWRARQLQTAPAGWSRAGGCARGAPSSCGRATGSAPVAGTDLRGGNPQIPSPHWRVTRLSPGPTKNQCRWRATVHPARVPYHLGGTGPRRPKKRSVTGCPHPPPSWCQRATPPAQTTRVGRRWGKKE